MDYNPQPVVGKIDVALYAEMELRRVAAAIAQLRYEMTTAAPALTFNPVTNPIIALIAAGA